MCSGTVFEKIRKEFAEIFKRRKPHKQGLGKALPNKIPTGAKGAISEFWHRGRILLCNCRRLPLSGFSVHRTDRAGLAARCGWPFSFRQYDAGTGLCCPLAAAFSLSAKDTFQRPPATRWTGIFQNFFRFCNARKGILATGGQRIFPFTPHTTAF